MRRLYNTPKRRRRLYRIVGVELKLPAVPLHRDGERARFCGSIMSPITHFFMGWAVSNAGPGNRKDRFLVTASGVVPDIDGLGAIADLLTRHTAQPTHWFDKYHHVLGHNIGFAIIVAALAFCYGTRRCTIALLAFVSFHLHLAGDLLGARGPDGYQWPVPYLLPFTDSIELTWTGQWALNAWPNFALTLSLIALSLYLAWKRGYSFVGLFSQRADTAFVAALRKRFGDARRYAGES